jgi:hypothetical protein
VTLSANFLPRLPLLPMDFKFFTPPSYVVGFYPYWCFFPVNPLFYYLFIMLSLAVPFLASAGLNCPRTLVRSGSSRLYL